MTIFKNKVALITGASGEIGREIAISLNKKGASIVLAGRRREALEDIASELKGDVKIIDESIDEYLNFDARNKLLSFYYTFFEILTANRSYRYRQCLA